MGTVSRSVFDGPFNFLFRSIVLAVAGLSAASAAAQDAPVVAPGESFTFDAPDAIDGDCGGALVDVCDFVVNEPPLRSFALAILPLQRVTGESFQYNDFEVPLSEIPGSPPDTVVMAQISGSAGIKGFLAVSSIGAASASVGLKVIDITDDPDAGTVIASRSLANYGLNTSPSASVSGSLGLEGQAGFPYVGLSGTGAVGISIGVAPKKQIVRDTVDFGLGVLLRRGHRYRLQLELTNSATNYVLNGWTVSSFFAPDLGGPMIPNLLDPFESADQPQTWLTFLEPLSKPLPELAIRKGTADQTVGILDGALSPALSAFMTRKQKRKQFKTHSLIAQLFPELGAPPYTLLKIAKNSRFLNLVNSTLRDVLTLPGVDQTNLAVMVQEDLFAQGDANRNRAIEESLHACRNLTSLYLPAQFGGELEAVIAVVDFYMLQSLNAGLDIGEAPAFFTKAESDFGVGFYKGAYKNLCSAYDQLVNPGPR